VRDRYKEHFCTNGIRRETVISQNSKGGKKKELGNKKQQLLE
jgi:hypothetical protein